MISKKRSTKKKFKKRSTKKKSKKQKSYYYLVKSNYLDSKKLNKIFDKRGNIWEPFNEQHPQQRNPDFLYMDEKYVYDKSLWKYKTTLKSGVDLSSDNYSISSKRNLYNHLIQNSKSAKNKSIEKHLMKQYELNLYDIFKGKDDIKQYKSLFNGGKVWILKPVHGMGGGMGIKIMETFKYFENHITKITNTNQYRWRNMNYKKYEKMRDMVKYHFNIEWVLQEYINNPLLVEGKKFHLRIFYLYDPNNMKFYILDKAKVLTARDKYKKSDYYNKDIHDTHFDSTNKTYYFPDYFNDTIGTKNTKSIMNQIKTIFKGVSKIMKAKCYSEGKNCFHIFGGDIMITDDYKVVLIEINEKP